MRITKKIAAGFSVLLLLVLLVGLVAIRTLQGIETVNDKMLGEFPQVTENIIEMRRSLVTGLKGCASYFLTGKSQYWDLGQKNLKEGSKALDALTKSVEASEYAHQYIDKLANLRENIDRFTQLLQEARQAEAEYQVSYANMLTQGNLAMELALQYQSGLLLRMDAPANAADHENVQITRRLLQLAQGLGQSVAQASAKATQEHLRNAVPTDTTAEDVLAKVIQGLRSLYELEQEKEGQIILGKIQEALRQSFEFSSRGLGFRVHLARVVAQLTQVEEIILDTSRALVDAIRLHSLNTLAEQNVHTHNTGTTLKFFLVGILAFGLLFAYLLMRHIGSVLSSCLGFAQAVNRGELDQRLPVGRRDEMGLIAEAMNSMLDNLHHNIAEARLKEQEANEARKQAEEARCQSDEANKAKDDFLARMSHEIRTPMNAVIGLGHLCQQTRLDEQQRQYINKILSSANDLLGILNEILDFSKIEGGKLELDSLPFQLDVVMNNLARIMKQRSEQKGIQFSYNLDANIPSLVIGDPLRLTQVLINLTGNGVKFTEQGSVTVRVECLQSTPPHLQVRFSIIDTGIGMSPEQYKQMFQPFVQADGSNTRRFGGTGLGLSISQRLVKLMHGTLEAEVNPEGGSIFSFTIPLFACDSLNMPSTPVLENLRALVVDDSLLTQQVVASNIASLGVLVVTVDSGQEALDSIAKADASNDPFNLVVLDWRMPDMDGVETAHHIRKMELRSPPVLLMHSDYNLEEMLQLATDAGITAFLPKPATPGGFFAAIQEALGAHSNAASSDPSEAAQGSGVTNTVEIAPGASRILLVEDNEINQEIACELLKMAQFEVDTVDNGQKAVEAVENQPYALIFMDVQMPVMDGLEATRRIRAAGHRMPIIAMTAHAMRGDKEISLTAGMNDHLTKPLNPESLFAALNQWMPVSVNGADEDGKPTTQKIGNVHRTLPEHIEGFNLTAGLAAVGGNEKLYAGLLSKFAGRYATITEDITACLQSNDLATAVRLAHTVKGIAANLGAESLADAAGMLEKTITHDPSMTTPHLKTLVLRLADAVTAVWTALGYNGADSDASPKKAVALNLSQENMEKMCLDLEHAIGNMEMDWATAADVAQDVQKQLQGTDLEEEAALLAQAVEDFETQQAEEISHKLQMALRFTCKPSEAI